MVHSNLAVFLVFAGYLGIILLIFSLLGGADFWYDVQIALTSLVFIWIGKRIDPSVTKPIPK